MNTIGSGNLSNLQKKIIIFFGVFISLGCQGIERNTEFECNIRLNENSVLASISRVGIVDQKMLATPISSICIKRHKAVKEAMDSFSWREVLIFFDSDTNDPHSHNLLYFIDSERESFLPRCLAVGKSSLRKITNFKSLEGQQLNLEYLDVKQDKWRYCLRFLSNNVKISAPK